MNIFKFFLHSYLILLLLRMDLQKETIEKIKARTMSRKELADHCKVSLSTIQRIMNKSKVSDGTLMIINSRIDSI